MQIGVVEIRRSIVKENRYTAPANPDAKEVSIFLYLKVLNKLEYLFIVLTAWAVDCEGDERVGNTAKSIWRGWNWRSEGDILANGAFLCGLRGQRVRAQDQQLGNAVRYGDVDCVMVKKGEM
ncbi:hypothetical protein Tco_0985276 [Tanacetum coccineum]